MTSRAPSHLPAAVVAYIDDGGATGETRRENRGALDRWRLVPRAFVDVSSVTTSGVLLGAPVDLPVAIAPMAGQRMVHPDGEMAMARAAARAGVPMILSLSSTVAVEEIGAVDGLAMWFQLYPFADAAATDEIVARAIAAGARGIVVTVDMPPPGRLAALGRDVPLPSGVHYAHHGVAPEMSHRIVWEDLRALAEGAGRPVVVKGILHPDDARRAVELGAAGVVVSNHGGRVLDGIVGAADALAGMGSVGAPLLLDGGIATGVDIVRALALGADGVLAGRILLWALARGGEEAVFEELQRMAAELERALAVVGATAPSLVGAGHVQRRR